MIQNNTIQYNTRQFTQVQEYIKNRGKSWHVIPKESFGKKENLEIFHPGTCIKQRVPEGNSGN
jgi:hypothetical protein